MTEIDASLAAEPATTRNRLYRDWRHDYAALDPARFPAAVSVASHLYEGSADERLAQLKSSMGCGTRCGSCIPRIKQLVHATPAPQSAALPVAA